MLKTLKAAGAALALSASVASAETIVEIAAGDERFSTLVAAVTAAGLGDTLSGDGPFTVFAPTNDAFAALPEGTVETLLKPENRDQLVAVLTYHVGAARIAAGDLAEGANPLTPVNADAALCVFASDKGVMVDDGSGEMAEVIIADIAADNGIIHVINKVLIPGDAPNCE